MYSVLIVDDEYMIRQGIEKLVNWNSLKVKSVYKAASGSEALECVKNNNIDIVITDITMPGKSGIDFLKESKAENIEFKTIIMSGYQEFEYAKKAIEFGVKDYLVKPINKVELNNCLECIVQELDEQKLCIIEKDLNELLRKNFSKGACEEIMLKHQQLKNPAYLKVIILEHEDGKVLKKLIEKDDIQWYTFTQDNTLICIDIDEGLKLKKYINVYDVKVFNGEKIDSFMDIGRSYSLALKKWDIYKFYGQYLGEDSEVGYKEDIPFINLSVFNKLVASKERHQLIKELDKTISYFEGKKANPNVVKNTIYYMFMTCLNYFHNIDDIDIEDILKVNSFEELKALVNEYYKILEAENIKKNYSDIILKTLSTVKNHYSEDISLESISKELHINRMYLGQLFKKEVGKSFATYLNKFRLEKAKQELIYTDYTIDYIAEEVGYFTTSYFYKIFKKEIDMSPKEFRDKFKNI